MGFYVINKDELYHHGILGMKWGKRNGPPYPLASSSHSQSEKKAGWRKSLDVNNENSLKSINSSDKVRRKNVINEKKESKKQRNSDNDREEKDRRKGLTDSQKKALKIGATVAGTALLAYGAYKLGSKDKLGDIGIKGSQIVDRYLKLNKGAGDFLNDIDDLSISTGFKKNLSNISISDSCSKVNKGYSTGEAKYRNNCFSAVTADLLNRANNGKGLDVVARAATDSELRQGGMSFNDILKPYSGASIDDIIVKRDNVSNAKDAVAKSILSKCNGEDGYGIIKVRRSNNSSAGHYIKWESVNGKVEFSDSLSGTIGADKYFNAIGSGIISRGIEYSRVDGLAVNPFEIAKLVKGS